MGYDVGQVGRFDLTQLEGLYERARSHPWYQHRFDAVGYLPVLNKDELYAMLAGREQEALFAHNTYWSPSGGSGARPPLYFPTAVEENLEHRVARRLEGFVEGVVGVE